MEHFPVCMSSFSPSSLEALCLKCFSQTEEMKEKLVIFKLPKFGELIHLPCLIVDYPKQ